VTPICFGPNISKTAGDRELVTMEHPYEMHVTPKGQGRDPNIFEAEYIENAWR